jgi:hypothetical protein
MTKKEIFIQDNIEFHINCNTVVKEFRVEINISPTSDKLQHFYNNKYATIIKFR